MIVKGITMKSVQILLLLLTCQIAFAVEATTGKAEKPVLTITEIGQTVLKMPLEAGVTADDAISAMLHKAADIDMKKVGHQRVSRYLKRKGVDAPRLEILQFCRPEDAIKMVQFNVIYAAYMPCRIALVEDQDGVVWLEMLNLDMLINNFPLPEELRRIAITINGQMLEILTAGATGAR